MAISSAYPSAQSTAYSGQGGNAMPLAGPGSTDVLVLDYGLMAGFRKPVWKVTYSSAGNTIGSSMSGGLIYYEGVAATAGAGYVFTLPDPDPGLWFEFRGVGACGASAATIWNAASATGAFIIGGDSGGADGITVNATTNDELGQLEFIGISTASYVVSWKWASSVPSTGAGGVAFLVSS